MDERICTGHDYTLFLKTFQQYMRDPTLLEKGHEESVQGAELTAAAAE